MAKLSDAGGRRALWTMVDQALSSLSTAAMSIVVAHVSTKTDYGRFSLAFVVYTFMIGISRSLASTPFILHHAAEKTDSRRVAGLRAAGLSVAIALVGGLVIIPLSLLVGGIYRVPMTAMAVFLVGLLLQDSWRMLLVAAGRPAAATAQDALVVGLQVLVFAGCIATGRTSPSVMICAWAIPTTLASSYGIIQWGGLPVVRTAWSFLTGHWDTSRFMLLEYVAVQGASQIAWLLIPLLGTAVDVGALRGGMTLLGTLNIVGNSIYMFALSEVLRRGAISRRALLKVGGAVTGVIGAVTVLFGLTLIVLPRAWGVQLLGETWDAARATMVPLTFYMLGVAFSTGPQTIMRARRDTRSTFRVNLVLGPVLLACVCLGQYLGKAPGAAWGFAAATMLTAPLWWFMALRSSLAPRRALPDM